MKNDSDVVRAFSADHVARLTGLTERQLQYWDRQGFFRPTYSHAGEGMKPVKVYTFGDVLGLRVIFVLLHEHKLSVQNLRKVARELRARSETPWASLTLAVCKGEVVVIDRGAGRGVAPLSGQYVLVPIIDQIRYLQDAVTGLSARGSDKVGMTEKRRNVAHNARVFAGTRIPVRVVEQFLDAGYDTGAILREYPSLQRGDVDAVVEERRHRQAA